MRMVLEGDQRRHVAVDDEPHAAAVAAVAAVGPAPGDVRLAPEADGARAAVTALDVKTALVDELRHPARLGRGVARIVRPEPPAPPNTGTSTTLPGVGRIRSAPWRSWRLRAMNWASCGVAVAGERNSMRPSGAKIAPLVPGGRHPT